MVRNTKAKRPSVSIQTKNIRLFSGGTAAFCHTQRPLFFFINDAAN